MCRYRYPSSPVLALSLFFVATLSASALDWDIEVLEPQVDFDISAPVVLDSNDIPHVAYFNDAEGDSASIIYAYRRESGWLKQTAADNQVETGNSSHPVLALDSNDNPYICYRDRLGRLSYIYRTGSNWSSEITIDAQDRCSPQDVIFDSNDMMNVVYLYYVPPYDWEHGQLKAAVGTGTSFTRTVIEPNGNYLSSSIAVDSNETPHLSYYDENNDVLVYAVKNGNSWIRQEVDSVGDVSSSIHGATGLALDSNDLPHISYYHFGAGDLKYAHWNGADWLIQTVESPNNVGRYSSLALDSYGNPQIAYQDASNGALKYASFNGSSWQIELVDDTGSSGRYASLALDSYDRPHISHSDLSNYSIRYASITSTCGEFGDFDRNCYIDFNDFSRFASWWLIGNCADSDDCQGRDFDETGTVDTSDLNILCSNWLRYPGL